MGQRWQGVRILAGLMVLSLLVTAVPWAGIPVEAQASELFFSEYIEGSSYNKALEIYNGTGGTVDLSTYTVELYSNGVSSASQSMGLSGLLPDGTVYVVAHPAADGAILSVAAAMNGSVVNFNGDDAVALKNGGALVDVIGQIGTDPGSEWGSGDVSTKDHTIQRKEYVCTGDTDGSDAFDPALEWDGFAQNTFDGLGTHTASCGGTIPGQPLPLSEGFDDCTLAGWEIVSVDADVSNTWSCSAQYSNIDASGYGDSAPADEWLITPPLNLDAQENDTLTFRNYTNYSDIDYPQLSVLYSTDYDGGGDPTSATWVKLTGINYSPAGSGYWVDSGNVDLSGISGTNVYVAFRYVSSGIGGGSAATWRLDGIEIFEQEPPPEGWVINEIHADPDASAGDANGDDAADSSNDEFVEIYNNTGADADISGWTLTDGYGVRHTFLSGSVVAADCAVLVFGGGTPTGAFGGAVVQTANGAYSQLGLNNGGDTVTLLDASGPVADYAFGGEGGDNQSLTRSPDVTGPDPLVKHSTVVGSGGALYSPGTMVDGTKFPGCTPITKIHEVQGSGSASPLDGYSVAIEGIVVGDFQDNGAPDHGDLKGFYVQEEDADADGDPLSSEGVFVYDGYSPAVDVQVGDLVRVKGQVAEYNDLTEISPVSEVLIASSGNPLPTPATVFLPVSTDADLEAYEGMSVTFPQALHVAEVYNFARYGQIVLSRDRQYQPTAVHEPGSPGALQLAQDNALGRITLDDGRTKQNPDPAWHPNGAVFDMGNLFRGGDQVKDVTGVVSYDYGEYRIQPTQGADYIASNPRPSQPESVGGNLKVASFNVLNYFTTMGSRGADDPDEFIRQRDKIFAALAEIDADVVGLIEIENNGTAVQDLVNGLNQLVGAGTYDYIDTGLVGGDEITVAFIYQPETVSLIGDFAVLDDSSFTDPNNLGQAKNRPALAQTFMDRERGGVVTAVVNHLKSKGSGCGDGDDDPVQGNCNLTRTLAAQALVEWLATDPTGSGDADFLIIGDLNAYDKEDPIDVVVAGGYTDLVDQYQGEYAYSYVFDGQLGYLDHSLANADLLDEVTGTTIWQINSDEPNLIDYDMSWKEDAQDLLYAPDAYRSSDHDPVIVGLDVCDEIAPTLQVSVDPDTLWPPNHKYVDVTAEVLFSDNFDPSPVVEFAVTSSEPDSRQGKGDKKDDIVIIDDTTFKLRAERFGTGEGRVYTITYRATDACGNSTEATATVTVPHDEGE